MPNSKDQEEYVHGRDRRGNGQEEVLETRASDTGRLVHEGPSRYRAVMSS